MHLITNFAFQSTLLLLVLLGSSLLLRRRSAGWHHATLACGALCMPLLLATSHFRPTTPIHTAEPTPQIETRRAAPVERSREISIGTIENSTSSTTITSPRAETLEAAPTAESASNPLPIPQFLNALWMTGVGLVWLRLFVGTISLMWTRRRLSAFCELEELLNEESSAMGVTSSVNVLRSTTECMPTTWGLRKHVIVLPASAEDWPETRVRHVLRHELAHIRRRDCAGAWATTASLALVWFNPLAWWMSRELKRTRESACDDRVLENRLHRDAGLYATDLVKVVADCGRQSRPFALGVALGMGARHVSQLKYRLSAILDPKKDRRPITLRSLLTSFPLWLIALLAIGTTGIVRQTTEAEPVKESEATDMRPVTRKYSLVQQQIDQLTRRPIFEADPDPFADDSSTTGGTTQQGPKPAFDAVEFAALARESFVSSFGIAIKADDPVEFTFSNRYTMTVSAPLSVLDKISWGLDTLLQPKQIEIRVHVFDLEDPEALANYLAADLNRSSIIDRDAFLKLRDRLKEDAAVLKTTPSLTTHTGRRAQLEMVREFIYPTEYDPPEIPANANAGATDGIFPVTPATPTAFETRYIGLSFEVETRLNHDHSITLDYTLEEVALLGMINYGSPINGVPKDGKEAITLTENRIEMPIFETERLKSSGSIKKGEMLLVAGFGAQSNPDMNITSKGPDGSENTNPHVRRFDNKERKNRLYVIEARVAEEDQ